MGGNKGRIRYVEPTNFTDAKSGTLSDMISYPYEDYNMAVDLSIRVANRYSCGLGEMTGDFKTISYSTNKGTLSFLGGTKIGEKDAENDNYLTVNYTDISMTDPSSNTAEALGIESINITYNSWLYPQITIKFVDVRGASVMLPAENGYYTVTEAGATNDIYKSLFTFPYPIFILKVKGFYGRGVTYKLAVQKTSIELDSNSGNFIITASFIGYMFGIYADIPMTFLAVAPYMDKGKEYWDQQVSNGTFKFLSADGTPQCDMLKIPELRLKLAQVANNEEYVSAATDGQQVQDNLDERLKKLNSLIENYPFEKWSSFKNNRGNSNLYRIIDGHSVNEEIIKINREVKEFYDNVKSYDDAYGTRHASLISDLKDYGNEKSLKGLYVRYEKSNDGNNSYKVYSSMFSGDDLANYNSHIKDYDDVRKWIKESYSGFDRFSVLILPNLHDSSYYKSFNIDSMNEERSAITEKKNSESRRYKEKQDLIAEKALGFRPSIKNIYDLAFAHMDTFINCFYDTMKIIRGQLETKDKVRNKSTYNLDDGDTDTERVKDRFNNDNGISRAKYLPPFTAYYKDDYSNGEKRKQLMWPEELVGGDKLEETKFVRELLKGVQLYSDRAEDVEKMIADMNEAAERGENTSFGGDCPSPSVYAFIPLTTYDFVNKDKMSNPYSDIKSLIDSNSDAVDGNIMAAFAMRAFYYIATSNVKDSSQAKAFGVIEAINFFKAVGDSTSEKFINFIKTYADNKNSQSESDGFLNDIIATETNNITKFWQFNGANTNKSLFKANGNNYQFNLYNGTKTYLPLGTSTLERIKSDYVKGDRLSEDENYLTDKGYSVSDDETFFIFEERDYINTIFSQIDNEIKTAEESLSANRQEYQKRSADEYGSFAGGESTLNKYKNNLNSKFNNDLYPLKAFCDGEEKSINDIKSVICEQKESEQMQTYIKYPSWIDEDNSSSLFEHRIYKQQTDIKAKAYLFLASIPVKGDGDTGGIESKSENGVSLKVRLLREGSYYWRYDIEKSGKTSVKTDGFKKPEAKETFIGYRIYTSDSIETLRPIAVSESFYNYNKWKDVSNCSNSRRAKLKKYFEDWATDNGEFGFSGVESLLSNKKYYSGEKISNGLNIKLSTTQTPESENARRIQTFLRNLYFKVCTTFDYYNGLDFSNASSSSSMNVGKALLSNAFKGFSEQLHNIYGDTAKEAINDPNASTRRAAAQKAMDPFNNTDLRLSTYMNLKNLYDKWLCNPPKGVNGWKIDKTSRRKENLSRQNGKSDFDNFIYTDSYYHNIGLRLTVNITKVSEWLSNCLPTSNMNIDEGVLKYNGRSLYEFISEVAQNCGGMLIALPQRFGCQDETSMVDMFRPISINSNWNDDDSSFVFMYHYEPSKLLGDERSNLDMNGWTREGDGFYLDNDADIIGALADDNGYNIPAFGVTYAKQNQSYFKNITLSTETHGVTEAAIHATMAIASKASESPRESTLFGQDLYRVYSNYSYECKVETMGNMQITPMMYFQLNNVPMWKGAYMIKKVVHDIVAGSITTKFEGIRQNKYAIPMTDCFIVSDKQTGDETGGSGSESNRTVAGSNISSYSPTNSSGHVPSGGNPNVKLKAPIDFDDSDITEQKPIIALTPAHGPRTQKSLEWRWSSSLVDAIIEEFENNKNIYKFKDGTPFSKHVQRCNKNGNGTDNRGYSTMEVQKLIDRYGSEKVISMVPHWNGGGGKYYCVFYGLGPSRKGGTDDSGYPPNPKSIRFAQVYAQCAEEFKNNVTSSENRPPEGAMSGNIRYGTLRDMSGRFDATDGAVMRSCPSVLTENWFADYRVGSSKAWTDETDQTKCMKAWLEGRGLKPMAKFHATAIKRFIDTL